MLLHETESKEMIKLYSAYEMIVNGKTAIYRYTCFNEPDKKVITHFTISDCTGKIIIDFPCGNNFIFIENFERTIDNFLFWIKENSPDKYIIENKVYDSLVQSDSLFNYRMEQLKKKEQEKVTQLNYIQKCKELENDVKKAAETFNIYLWWNYSQVYILDFTEEQFREMFDSASSQIKENYIDFAINNQGCGIDILYTKDLSYAYASGIGYYSMEDLEELLKDMKNFRK